MQQIAMNLRFAYARIALGRNADGMQHLLAAQSHARYTLKADVPRNRCLRAYIAQAIQALEQANANS